MSTSEGAPTQPRSVTLLLHCPLRLGLAASLTQFVYTHGGGPIIEQDVLRVSHRHSVQDLIRSGRDLEKVVLSRAIWSHIQRKIIVHEGRTIVFH